MLLFSVSSLWLFACFGSGLCFLEFILDAAKEIGKFAVGNTLVSKSTPEIIQSHNYSVEIHHVTTTDGYILELHRIPGKMQPDGSRGTIAFIQHGLACDSGIFVVTGPQKALAYLLADSGYDVWIGNSRGNRYSRNHTHLNPDASDGQFWQFSWHELGVYDLTAVIDYVLQITQKPILIYIGHSQGNTQFFVMCSERPEYNKKIEAMFALSPVVLWTHAKSPLMQGPLNAAFHAVENGHELFERDSFLTRLIRNTCISSLHVERLLCASMIYLIFGVDKEQMDLEALPTAFSVFPSSCATQQVVHFEQNYKSKRFQQFDHGRDVNLLKYGSPEPPEYNLTLITAPVALYYGLNDLLCDSEDVHVVYSQLSNPIGNYAVPLPTFNHFDFLFGRDVKTLVYDSLMSNMSRITRADG